MLNETAHERFDWGLLVVLLVVQIARPDWRRIMTEDNEGQDVPSIERIMEVCHRESHQDLRVLLQQLVARAEWQAYSVAVTGRFVLTISFSVSIKLRKAGCAFGKSSVHQFSLRRFGCMISGRIRF